MASDSKLTFVLGGARSGKSLFAERLIADHEPPYLYFATAQAFDDEMRARIATHQERRAPVWRTIEAPHDLAAAVAAAPQERPALIDCLTLWLTNRLLAEADLAQESASLIEILNRRPGRTVVVSNEVGLGGISSNALSRRFCDAAGLLHQRLAAAADEVHFIAAGLSLRMK